METQRSEERVVEAFHQGTALAEELALLEAHDEGLGSEGAHLRHQEGVDDPAQALELPHEEHPLGGAPDPFEMGLEDHPDFEDELTQIGPVYAVRTGEFNQPELLPKRLFFPLTEGLTETVMLQFQHVDAVGFLHGWHHPHVVTFGGHGVDLVTEEEVHLTQGTRV